MAMPHTAQSTAAVLKYKLINSIGRLLLLLLLLLGCLFNGCPSNDEANEDDVAGWAL